MGTQEGGSYCSWTHSPYDDFSDVYILRTDKLKVESIFSSALVGLGYDSSNTTSHPEESYKAF